MRVQTEAIHFSADIKLVNNIEKKLNKLEPLADKATHAKVVLKLENSGQIREKIVEIRFAMPSGVIFVKENAKTFEVAIDAAVACLKRQIVRLKDKEKSMRRL